MIDVIAVARSINYRRSSTTSASSRRAALTGPLRAGGLDERAVEDLRQRRRQLTAAASALYFDINEIKLRLRVQVHEGNGNRKC